MIGFYNFLSILWIRVAIQADNVAEFTVSIEIDGCPQEEG